MAATLAVMAALCQTTGASAQTMRTLTISRPVMAEHALTVQLDFSGGTLVLTPGPAGVLYSARMHYDADRYSPIQQYDAPSGVLRIGVQPTSAVALRVADNASGPMSARVQLSPDVSLLLDATLAAADASIDLGGTRLGALTIHSSASRGTVDFSRPTTGKCLSATFSVGASQLEVHHLAQSHCAAVRVDGGAGGATLSFDGIWTQDMSLVVDLAMGGLTLQVPNGIGVRLTGDRFLAPFDRQGFVKSGDAWVTPGYQRAPHKLNVELKAAMVGINLEWMR